MYVIGTAGHVDHGKSTLVQALTGIDTDRLKEEKDRGLSIDLGFADLTLTDGNQVSIVDVPGHERFISNMLAGVASIDLAIMVVAADEGIMPQTQEHLDILELLNVNSGLVAITKKDLVDSEWLGLVVEEVESFIADTTLRNSAILTVSAVTGDGVQEVAAHISSSLHDSVVKRDLGRPRLPIDRVFTMPGFGAVVTGTLIDGFLDKGQEIELLPKGNKARVRGLQTHNQKLDRVGPASRVAVNLSGVSYDQIERGDVLSSSGWLSTTIAIDVHLKVISNSPRSVRHNMFVTVHIGATETIARLRLLETDSVIPGEYGWAQLKFDNPMVVVKGDRFIIRSNNRTLGGGVVVDSKGRRHQRKQESLIHHLEIMENGSDIEIISSVIQLSEPTTSHSVGTAVNFAQSDVDFLIKNMTSAGLVVVLSGSDVQEKYLYTSAGWSLLIEKVCKYLGEHHNNHPLELGLPKEQLRNFLGLSHQVFTLVMLRLFREEIIVDEGLFIRIPSHERSLNSVQSESASNYIKSLEHDPFSPPTDLYLDPDILALLADEGRVVKVNDEIVFPSTHYSKIVERITAHIREAKGITVGEVRDMFGTSRKYALALMEHLDHKGVTRRVGDSRVLK